MSALRRPFSALSLLLSNFNFKPTCETDHTQVVWKSKRVFKTLFPSSDIFGMYFTKRKNVFKIYRKILKVFLWNWSIAVSFLCVMFNVNLWQFHSFEGKLQEFEMSFCHCSLSLISFFNIKELMCHKSAMWPSRESFDYSSNHTFMQSMWFGLHSHLGWTNSWTPILYFCEHTWHNQEVDLHLQHLLTHQVAFLTDHFESAWFHQLLM